MIELVVLLLGSLQVVHGFPHVARRCSSFSRHHIVESSLASPALELPVLPSETLAELSSHDLVVVPNFLSPLLVDSLLGDLAGFRRLDTLCKSAVVGQGSVDWFEVLLPDSHAPFRPSADLLGVVEGVRLSIERSTGTALDKGLTELKFAFYPSGGCYQRHLDALQVPGSGWTRAYSFILYLNKGWLPRHGGCLRVFRAAAAGEGGGTEKGEAHLDVPPAPGTLVVFKSDTVAHEVLPTNSMRVAIVGWLGRRLVPSEDGGEEKYALEVLSPLALAIRQHYEEQGKLVKMGGGGAGGGCG